MEGCVGIEPTPWEFRVPCSTAELTAHINTMSYNCYINGEKMDEQKLREVVKNCISIAEVLKSLNMSVSTGNYRTFHRCVKRFQINTDHFLGQSHLQGKSHESKTTQPLNKVLTKNSAYSNINHLKKRLIRENLLVYKCYECGINSWRDNKLSLQLDHINGIYNDHRIENLRLLCPNCHSQTETFSGKNKK